ncbi:MAG TPA: mannose-1-phosphate guanylyltransferase, partial [Thermoanaerobaculia bacterium]|nr:mannose-1-phosphate guanylyltransferase [Thermoanaerobaculia bacterium]
MSERAAILLAGGAGTRLWPLSTDENPKQFLPLFEGRSLLQIAFGRMRSILAPDRIFISTNERYREKVAAQLPEVPAANILVEPARRNTAPAIAVCCADVARALGDPTIGIFPSDHFIADEAAFLAVVERAYSFATDEPYLVTIGIDPDHPNTGFGYLELGEELAPGVIRLLRFVEKPDRAKAEEFIRSGKFVWNGGMFVWRQSIFEAIVRAVAPAIDALLAGWKDESTRRAAYEAAPSISIDFAVMEKAPNVATVRGEFGWSDVGSWKAVASIIGEGRADGVTRAESESVLVQSDATRPIILLGVRNLAVVESPDGLLVMDLEKSEALSAVVKT